MELVIFFCSGEYDLHVLAAEMDKSFSGVQVIGCTTAGEIGPAGYREHSLCGASFAAGSFNAAIGCIEFVRHFEIGGGRDFVHKLLHDLKLRAPQASAENSFAVQLIDGLSVREEPVTRVFQQALGKRTLVGGSAGDGLRFKKTRVYFGGRFRTDSVALALVTTTLPFKSFMTQHFVATDRRVVVTEADVGRRLVRELDGRPAAEAYAELVGVEAGDLDPMRFAASPMVVVIGGVSYVRSISKAEADGSLKFYCAIDKGMVLRVARGEDLLGDLEDALANIRADIGEPQLILGFDCILRRLEVAQHGLVDRVAELLRNNRTVGFATYGEQYQGVHVNQTFTGIAVGSAPQATDG